MHARAPANTSSFEQVIRKVEAFCHEGVDDQDDNKENCSINLFRIDRAIYRNLEALIRAARADLSHDNLLCQRQINCRTTMLNTLMAFIQAPCDETKRAFDEAFGDFEHDKYAEGSCMSPYLKELMIKFALMFTIFAIAGVLISGIVIGNVQLANKSYKDSYQKSIDQLLAGLASAGGISIILILGVLFCSIPSNANYCVAQIPAYEKTRSQRELLNAIKKLDASFSTALTKHGLLAVKVSVVEDPPVYPGPSSAPVPMP